MNNLKAVERMTVQLVNDVQLVIISYRTLRYISYIVLQRQWILTFMVIKKNLTSFSA